MASKLLTGKAPEIIEAVRFEPSGTQEGLRSIDIAGNPEYRIDPYEDDFYRRLIDLRSEVKGKLKTAKHSDDTANAATLDAEQLALKICANATSYGIFVELNVRNRASYTTLHATERAMKDSTPAFATSKSPAGTSIPCWQRSSPEGHD